MKTKNRRAVSRKGALAQVLGLPTSNLPGELDEKSFTLGEKEYLVLTEKEAWEKAGEYIRETLWAFNASFILDHLENKIEDQREYEEAEKAIKEMQGKLCESANPLISAMIKNKTEFIADAIRADGLAHFLAFYDDNEIQESGYLIYRVN